VKNTRVKISFGDSPDLLRIEPQLSLCTVADILGIEFSLLPKIEKDELIVQAQMFENIASLFNLDYWFLRKQFLTNRMEAEYGKEPFSIESLENYVIGNK
jgi:transcriptional regulator with XRE-family HTH domain